MDIKYKIIEKTLEKYDTYIKALYWDKDNTYCIDKNRIDGHWLVEVMIGVYDDKELVGLGSILPNYNEKVAYLSSIIKPDYRKKGLASNLLKEMLVYCKDELKIYNVRVNILKRNLTCIDHIEKQDFDFVSFDDKVITYEKKLNYE